MQAPNGFVLTKAEKQLIELLRSLEYGELRIMVKDSKPIRVYILRPHKCKIPLHRQLRPAIHPVS